LVLFNGPFRSFTDVTARQFIHDILDGYFPSELKDRFPDGIPFKVGFINCDNCNNTKYIYTSFNLVGMHEQCTISHSTVVHSCRRSTVHFCPQFGFSVHSGPLWSTLVVQSSPRCSPRCTADPGSLQSMIYIPLSISVHGPFVYRVNCSLPSSPCFIHWCPRMDSVLRSTPANFYSACSPSVHFIPQSTSVHGHCSRRSIQVMSTSKYSGQQSTVHYCPRSTPVHHPLQSLADISA